MDVKEAVRAAKDHAIEVFEGETPRIEEVWFDDADAVWSVTIGLQRSVPMSIGGLLGDGGKAGRPTRMHYKTVRIEDATGKVVSVRNHEKMPVEPL